jgi:hypothetical protein
MVSEELVATATPEQREEMVAIAALAHRAGASRVDFGYLAEQPGKAAYWAEVTIAGGRVIAERHRTLLAAFRELLTRLCSSARCHRCGRPLSARLPDFHAGVILGGACLWTWLPEEKAWQQACAPYPEEDS